MILSLGTGVALMAAPARADIPPDPDSADANCTLEKQCSAGVFCEYAFRPGNQEESEKVGLGCRVEVETKGLERRCRNGGNYSGQELYCPKGATGTWSPGGAKPAPAPVPVPVPAPVPVAEPAKPDASKAAAEPAKGEVKSGCSVDPERSGLLWLGLVAVLGLRRRRS